MAFRHEPEAFLIVHSGLVGEELDWQKFFVSGFGPRQLVCPKCGAEGLVSLSRCEEFGFERPQFANRMRSVSNKRKVDGGFHRLFGSFRSGVRQRGTFKKY